MVKLLDPKIDVVFKMLFTAEQNRDLLRSLLTAILEPPHPIVDLAVLNPALPRNLVDDKAAVLDVRVRLADETLVDVEMQTQSHAALRPRLLYYWAKLYAGQLKRGVRYDGLRPAVVVLLADFRVTELDDWHSVFELRDRKQHALFSEHVTLHVLELPRHPERSRKSVVKWPRFLRARSPEDWSALMSDPDMARAKLALEELSQSEEAQWIAEARDLALSNHASFMHDARTEGEAKGRAEGKGEGRAEGEAKGKVAALLTVLDARGLALTAEERDLIGQCADPDVIDRWIRRAVTAATARELFVSE